MRPSLEDARSGLSTLTEEAEELVASAEVFILRDLKEVEEKGGCLGEERKEGRKEGGKEEPADLI
jgi:hypothetical protein